MCHKISKKRDLFNTTMMLGFFVSKVCPKQDLPLKAAVAHHKKAILLLHSSKALTFWFSDFFL